MWTPKRLLMLFLGFVFFLLCYVVYDLFLGHYDGLPPLPAEFQMASGAPGPIVEPIRPGPSGVVALLEKAFGAGCEEKDRRIKLEWRSQNIVLAAENWKLEGGKLHLERVSVAFFGKPRPGPDNAAEEINSVRGGHAEVEFERPLTTLRDVQKAKPVAGRIEGNVILQHNRRTPLPDDDIRLFTPWLEYREEQHRIWTDADIRLLDHTPAQATITAEGMEVLLLPSEKPGPAPAPKKGQAARAAAKTPQTHVKEVRLLRKVNMNLMVEQGSQFLSGSSLPQGAPVVKKNGPRAPVVVTCAGPFTYDAQKDQAEFTEHVTVLRRHPQPPDNPQAAPRYDQLDCARLLLTFARTKGKDSPPRTPSSKGGELYGSPPLQGGTTNNSPPLQGGAGGVDDGGMAIVSAQAMGLPLELRSDVDGAEKGMRVLAAELHYDKANEKTTLVGGKDGLQAELQGHHLRLFGTLLLFHAPGSAKDLREARAMGPGEIIMANDKARAASKQLPVTARWQEEMRWTKEPQPKGLPLDRIIFTGQAAFEDPERGRLSAAQLAVWLEMQEPKKDVGSSQGVTSSSPPSQGATSSSPPSQGGAGGVNAQRTKLRRVDAVGDVKLFSRELLIPQADRLRLLFADADPPPAATPTATAQTPPQPPLPPELLINREDRKLPEGPVKAKAPLELRAKVVDATLQRTGTRTDVERMQAEGEVKVTQAAIEPSDKPLDIRADRLDLVRFPTGHVIKLFSPEENPASAQIDRMIVLGPYIELDQTQNIVQVIGQGRMRMPSKSDFQGETLKEPTDVVLTWTKRMLFDGRSAEFDGHVTALQGHAVLSCGKLTVVLDRQISLRERLPDEKSKEQPAGLRRLLCNSVGQTKVRLEKRLNDGTPQFDYQRVQGEQLDFDNLQGLLIVQGPGQVDIIRPGQDMAQAAQGQPQPPPRPDQPLELKLTRILFAGRMEAQPKSGLVTFGGDMVQLFHIAGSAPDVEINEDHLPPGGLHVRCSLLKGMSRKLDEKKTVQEYEASRQVKVRFQDYFIQADYLKYDEQKGWLIMEGRNGNPVLWSQQKAPGAAPYKGRAQQIIYRIKEGTIHINNGDSINLP